MNKTVMQRKNRIRGTRPARPAGRLRGAEDAMGTVEIILIIVVLISLVIIFKTQITELVKSIFGTITSQSGVITG